MGLFKQKEALTDAAKYAITFSNKITEDKEKIRALADFIYQITPDEKKQALDQARLNMEAITKEILATEKQLKRLKPIVVAKIGDSRADPDTDPNLPREDTVKSP
jgi:multidrug resistance efflux pump